MCKTGWVVFCFLFFVRSCLTAFFIANEYLRKMVTLHTNVFTSEQWNIGWAMLCKQNLLQTSQSVQKENEGISYAKLCSYTGVNSEITTINRNTLYLLAILGNTVTKWYLWLLRLLSRSGVSKCSPGPRQPQLHITFSLISKAGLCKWSAWNSYKRILLLSLRTAAQELKKMSENKGKTHGTRTEQSDRSK